MHVVNMHDSCSGVQHKMNRFVNKMLLSDKYCAIISTIRRHAAFIVALIETPNALLLADKNLESQYSPSINYCSRAE